LFYKFSWHANHYWLGVNFRATARFHNFSIDV
jgi:hypothetical protein